MSLRDWMLLAVGALAGATAVLVLWCWMLERDRR